MKLSKIALSLMMASSGMSLANVAQAATDESFEFHGSFRAGTLSSEVDDWERSTWAGATKEMVGRLGIEADNDFGISFAKKWVLDNGKSVKVTVGEEDDNDNYSSSNFPDAFIEYDGIFESGIVWGGKRGYAKNDNYIFMTDFFYVDYSGTGTGIVDYEVGDAKVDLAYITSDRTEDEDNNVTRDLDTNNLMHAIHLGVDWGQFKIDAAAKYLHDNQSYTDATAGYWDNDNMVWVDATDATYTKYTEKGLDISATYSMDNFFGLPGNGFSKIIAQAGIGLGAQQLLGGTLTTYNAYRPGSVTKGGANGTVTMANNYDDDTSARVLLWGGYFFDNGINIFPSIQAQYNDHSEENIYDYWWSAMVRPTFPVSENFYVQSEIGYAFKNWNGGTWYEEKITIAPTFVMGTGTGPAPEVRFLASYLPQANGGDGDTVIGVQADVWW
jgi:maltoporin